ncbi:M1 family aminopeptidase [Nafulsella turpanensis]|uniref:M1 family aminopeptidase n=1 Tax=Nafulsella turpanensis TaxID=1265690 RepID=UPI000349FC2D|nr:M1 family aminopeptidase [Nafulsella turpanensis]
MNFWEIYRFEVTYQLRRASTWIYFTTVLGLTFLWITGFIDNARSGEIHLNSPLIIAGITAFSNLFGLLIIAALASDAILRDNQARMDQLLYTTPLSKITCLGGRFLGTFSLVSVLMLVVVPLGLVVVSIMPAVESNDFGPFRPMAYIGSSLLFTLPYMFIATMLLYSMVLLGRNAMLSYMGGVLLFLCTVFSTNVVGGIWSQWELGKLLDPSGFTILKELRLSLTASEMNEQVIELEGSLLTNRLLWLSISGILFTLAYLRFGLSGPTAGKRRKTVVPDSTTLVRERKAPVCLPSVPRAFGFKARVQQILYLTFYSFREMAASHGWLVVPAMAVILFLMLPELLEGPLGVPALPTTGRVIGHFDHFVIGMIVAMLITLYAGQLVWREREARMNEIADILPVSNGVQLISKLLALTLMVFAVQVVLMVTAISTQAWMGYSELLETGLYLKVFFCIQLVDYLLLIPVALAVHVLVNQKYVGHLLILLFYSYTILPEMLGIEHNLLIYGSDPGLTYSEMSGFNLSIAPWFWFKLYWAGWALLFILMAKLFWVRSVEPGLKWRVKGAQLNLTVPNIIGAEVIMILICASGTFIFYNTNVLNEFRTAGKGNERRVEYEQRFGKYRGAPQPQLTATSLHVEIYPELRGAVIHGVFRLENKTSVEIDTIHLAIASEVITGVVDFSRQAQLIIADEKLGHRIYRLEKALQPGDSLRLSFEVSYQSQGFRNRGINPDIAGNGTYIRNIDWLPAIGYQPNRELNKAEERKAYGLALRSAVRSLYDKEARKDHSGRERIHFEATIGTDADQVALAPGALRQVWGEKGRHYFHYKTDSAIRNSYPILSADYAVHETRWKGVEIQIFYHPRHNQNLERMAQSLQASLAYYSKYFGPYPHRHLRLVQYPGEGSLTSFPGLITYPEEFALLQPEEDPRNIDIPFAVVAHEVAHQWWGNQLIPAYVEGAPLITESLAWYSALGVVQETYGVEHLRRFLDVMREAYLTPRSKANLPLLRATDPFLAYRKGPFAMYALREYFGENQVNMALQHLLREYSLGESPLPTSLDLYRQLQSAMPDSLNYLLRDLFELNTYWELKTEQVWAEPLEEGEWRVTLEVLARKVAVDSLGAETELPMNDFIEIAVFADEASKKTIYQRKHRIHSGNQRITVLVPLEPKRAGVDPRGLLIDTKMTDNSKKVAVGGVRTQPKPN